MSWRHRDRWKLSSANHGQRAGGPRQVVVIQGDSLGWPHGLSGSGGVAGEGAVLGRR